MKKKGTQLIILKADNLVEKRNLLNEIKASYMTLQEMRFFTVYLSKINPRDLNTKEVIFPLSDFLKLMDIERIRIEKLRATTNSLLSKVINIPCEDGGYTGFQLFEKCQVYKKKDTNSWFIKIVAHKDSLPLMFDFKEQYFKYELWNALNLNSTNQIRMYEILKQYEKLGVRTVDLIDLKQLLGIAKFQYPRFNSFRERVLDSTQVALKKYTDIYFDYEPIRESGRRVTKIKFAIYKNKDYVSKLSLEEFISNKQEPEIFTNEIDEEYELYSEVFEGMFNRKQIELLYQLALPMIKQKVMFERKDRVIEMADYFRCVFKKFGVNSEQVKYPFAYVKKLITAEVENYV